MPLSPRLPFHPDETPFSWVARLAALHIRQTSVELMSDLGLKMFRLLAGHIATILTLCDRLGEEPEPVVANLIRHETAYHYALREERFSSSFAFAVGTRFCPLCLLEDGDGPEVHAIRRQRLTWRFRHLRTCPIHGLVLPVRAYRPGAPRDLAVVVPETGNQLEKIAGGCRSCPPSPLESYTLDRLRGNFGPTWLDGQSLEQAVRATEMLGMILEFGTSATPNRMTNEDWHQAASTGWEFTSRGEIGLRDAFDLLATAAPQSGHQQSPIAAFGGLYRWLDSGGHRIDRGPIREILRNHVLETRRFVPGRRFLGRTQPTLTPKNMTVDSPAG